MYLTGAYGSELVGSNECTWGPSHWCSATDVAQKCGMESWCIEKELGVYSKQKELLMSREMVGANECTWGPSHWCSATDVAKMCGMESWCIEQEMGVYTKQKELVMSRELRGSKKCTWGPAYWCATRSNAAACGKGAEAHCAKVGYADEQMVASRALV